jgi:hypothetical protein
MGEEFGQGGTGGWTALVAQPSVVVISELPKSFSSTHEEFCYMQFQS